MLLLNSSDILAQLLPEVHATLEPDIPPDIELSIATRKLLRALLLRAFHRVLTDEFTFDLNWIFRIKQDPFLSELSQRPWIDVDIIDSDGTYLIVLGDPR